MCKNTFFINLLGNRIKALRPWTWRCEFPKQSYKKLLDVSSGSWSAKERFSYNGLGIASGLEGPGAGELKFPSSPIRSGLVLGLGAGLRKCDFYKSAWKSRLGFKGMNLAR